MRPLHVPKDLKEDDFLLVHELERQIGDEGLHELSVERDRLRFPLGRKRERFLSLESIVLHHEELFVGELAPSPLEILDAFREMERLDIGHTGTERLLFAELRRHHFFDLV